MNDSVGFSSDSFSVLPRTSLPRRPSAARRLVRAALALLLAGAAIACVTNPSAEEVVDRTTPSICAKNKECSGDAKFSLAFPGGVDDCVAKTKEQFRKQHSDKLSASSVCTDAEIDKCINDLKAAPCGAGGAMPPVPCDC